jgi:hypothetical protein
MTHSPEITALVAKVRAAYNEHLATGDHAPLEDAIDALEALTATDSPDGRDHAFCPGPNHAGACWSDPNAWPDQAAPSPEGQERPRGTVDGVLYCYGGCGRRYSDFGLDILLPTPLWNQIAVGPPFDEAQESIEREGRGGVLCVQCIVDRLATLPDVTAAFIGVDDVRSREPAEYNESGRGDSTEGRFLSSLDPTASPEGQDERRSHEFVGEVCIHCGLPFVTASDDGSSRGLCVETRPTGSGQDEREVTR